MSTVGRTTNTNQEDKSTPTSPVDGSENAAVPVAAQGAPASPQAPQQPAGATVTPLTEKVRREAAPLRNALAFTQIVGVPMSSSHYKESQVSDLEWLVIPPLLAGQIRILEHNAKEGIPLPV